MSKIEDYGDKIGGAKKDLFADYAERLSGNLDARDSKLWEKPLSELFPKPDYSALAARGLSQASLAALCTARGQIPRKPTGARAQNKLNRWFETLRAARGVAISVMADRDPHNADRVMSKADETVRLTYAAMKTVSPDALSKAEGHHVVATSGHIYVITSGRKILFQARLNSAPLPELVKKAGEALSGIGGPRAPQRGKTEQEKVNTFLKKLRLYKSAHGAWSAELRTNSGRLVFHEGFRTVKEGQDWVQRNLDGIRTRIARTFTAPSERKHTARPRKGPERRTGDVTLEDLAKTFGLRGIEFGNYVEEKRRQTDLNEMWDSLSDLADALGVQGKTLGHGALGLAFGARGGGRAMAHYEASRRVINLTKTQGSGSTAHEWFHSADNAATLSDPTDKTARSRAMMSEGVGKTTASLRSAWSGYEARMKALDVTRSAAYWSKPEEMAARCFEAWLVDRLADLGIENDHLVEIERHGGAYPSADEMLLIGPEIEKFTAALIGTRADMRRDLAAVKDEELLADLFDDPDFP